jgi:hypothetical protein
LKVLNTRRIAEKLMQTMQFEEVSAKVNMVVTIGVKEHSVIPADVEDLRQRAEKLKKEMEKDGAVPYSVDRLMLLLMVESMIGPYLSEQPEMMNLFMNWIASESKTFDVKEFNENPYIKNIDFKNKQLGDFELKYNFFDPYEVDIYNVPKRIDQLNIDIPRVSCFVERFEYPAIIQKSIDSTWMSVSPSEVFTMESEIRKAKGRVLTLGCGMGYFAYMASMKDEVTSVTIIELEQSVIDLFETYILPQFKYKDKVKVIKADAIEYVRSIEDGEYDYCFADIWIGIEDIKPYFAVKEIGRRWRKTQIDYWIEDSFAVFLSASVWLEILKGFSETNKLDLLPENFQFSEDDKRKEKYIHSLLEDEEITKPEHIDYYLNPKNIIELINKTELIY